MKCCTLEEWFTCGKIGKEHCSNKIMSDKDMSKLISEDHTTDVTMSRTA